MKIENKKQSPSALIIAAEDSSTLYAERILEHWKERNVSLQTFGIGSRKMEGMGFEIFGRSEELAVTGIQEVLAHYKKIKQTFDEIMAEVKKRKPCFALLMDYPGFNLRLAKELKAEGIPVIYYISPQIWAWKEGRVKTIREFVDRMLVVLPFEVGFYKKHNVEAEFVGHPILDELDAKFLDPSQVNAARERYGFSSRHLVLGIMPGSRKKEVELHLETQVNVARKLYKKYPNLKIAFLAAPSFSKEYLQEKLEGLGLPYVILKDEPFQMISLTDFVLVASGTATLMVGLLEKPMVIMYRFHFLTSLIARWVTRKSSFFGLVNVIMEREIVPERFQGAANVDALTDLMSRYFDDEDYRRKTLEDLKELKTVLGRGGATERVTKVLEEYIPGLEKC